MNWEEAERAAAVMVQCAWRGRAARLEMKAQKNACTMIQVGSGGGGGVGWTGEHCCFVHVPLIPVPLFLKLCLVFVVRAAACCVWACVVEGTLGWLARQENPHCIEGEGRAGAVR